MTKGKDVYLIFCTYIHLSSALITEQGKSQNIYNKSVSHACLW